MYMYKLRLGGREATWLRCHTLRRASVIAASLCAGLALLVTGTGTAFGLTGCRSDPVITLSNGVTLVMWESIGDSASDVKSVKYQVDVPTGVSVRSVVYAGDVAANLQSVTVSANENSGNYDTYSTVKTSKSGIQTAAYAQANFTVSAQTVGPTPNPLHSHLHLG